ncbi:hypothetical protein [Thaumasiovibrio sp. DFM-14]|uniref:hypothetical protein n=1 Tax=Thaumasiovibrio sp. DFM-14 TaxID=3384792 RepID=UPI0039A34A1C
MINDNSQRETATALCQISHYDYKKGGGMFHVVDDGPHKGDLVVFTGMLFAGKMDLSEIRSGDQYLIEFDSPKLKGHKALNIVPAVKPGEPGIKSRINSFFQTK